MIFCPSCGKGIQTKFAFCPYCGANTTALQTQPRSSFEEGTLLLGYSGHSERQTIDNGKPGLFSGWRDATEIVFFFEFRLIVHSPNKENRVAFVSGPTRDLKTFGTEWHPMIERYKAHCDYQTGVASKWFAGVVAERKQKWQDLNEYLVDNGWESTTESALERKYPRHSLTTLGFYTQSFVRDEGDGMSGFSPTELDEYRFRRPT